MGRVTGFAERAIDYADESMCDFKKILAFTALGALSLKVGSVVDSDVLEAVGFGMSAGGSAMIGAETLSRGIAFLERASYEMEMSESQKGNIDGTN